MVKEDLEKNKCFFFELESQNEEDLDPIKDKIPNSRARKKPLFS